MAKLPDKLNVKINISELIGSVDSLEEAKAKRNGDITPKELIRILLNELNNSEIESLAVIRKYKDGSISSGWTTVHPLEGLGMGEYLKQCIWEEADQ